MVIVENPCKEPWQAMIGDNQSRKCGKCQQTVYDLAEMTSTEVSQLLCSRESNACVRLSQQPDGRLLTADSHGGMRIATWRFLKRRSSWLAGMFAIILLPGCHARTMGTPTLDRINRFTAVENQGDVAISPPDGAELTVSPAE